MNSRLLFILIFYLHPSLLCYNTYLPLLAFCIIPTVSRTIFNFFLFERDFNQRVSFVRYIELSDVLPSGVKCTGMHFY